MNKTLILLTLALSAAAHAQDVHDLTPDGKCLSAPSSFYGVTDGKLWTVRQCRPPAAVRGARVWWNRYYTITDPLALPQGIEAVITAYRSGDRRKTVDLGEALINKPLTDPSFAKAYAAAQAAAVERAIPVSVSFATGAACDCTQPTAKNGMCPLASAPKGPLVSCHGL